MNIDGPLVSDTIESLASFVERYQTIFAALLAIWAAKIAVKPVWKQVIATNTQTQIAHLETLQKLLGEALHRAKKVEEDFREPSRQMNYALYDPRGEFVEIDGHTAHHLGRQISGLLGWYLDSLAGTDSVKVEAAKSDLKAAIVDLESALNTVEWMDFNGQTGDDYAFTDEEWAKMSADADAAAKAAAPKGAAVSRAFRDLGAAQADTIKHIRTQVRNIEHALAKLS